jgi:hypothetical protein
VAEKTKNGDDAFSYELRIPEVGKLLGCLGFLVWEWCKGPELFDSGTVTAKDRRPSIVDGSEPSWQRTKSTKVFSPYTECSFLFLSEESEVLQDFEDPGLYENKLLETRVNGMRPNREGKTMGIARIESNNK